LGKNGILGVTRNHSQYRKAREAKNHIGKKKEGRGTVVITVTPARGIRKHLCPQKISHWCDTLSRIRWWGEGTDGVQERETNGGSEYLKGLDTLWGCCLGAGEKKVKDLFSDMLSTLLTLGIFLEFSLFMGTFSKELYREGEAPVYWREEKRGRKTGGKNQVPKEV